MLKKIDWSDKFLTGHKEVDLQHQYFAELINRAIWNMMEHNDWRYHLMLIEELILYAHFHFKSEENILYVLEEPNLQEHKKIHIELIDNLSSRVWVIEKDTKNSLLLIDSLVKWFLDHTTRYDVEVFAKYREKTKAD